MSVSTIVGTARVSQESRADRLDVWLDCVCEATEFVFEQHRRQSITGNACPLGCINKEVCDLFTLAVTGVKLIQSIKASRQDRARRAAHGGNAHAGSVVPVIRFDCSLRPNDHTTVSAVVV